MTTVTRVCALTFFCALSAACDGTSITRDAGSTRGYLHGYVTSLVDSTAMAGASVSLVEAVPYRVVAGPVMTDVDGHYAFPDAPVGSWYIFLHTRNYFMFDTADPRVTVEPGKTVQRDIALVESELWDDNGDHFAGIVTDAETGEPIVGAYVSSTAFSVTNSFFGIPFNEAITDSLGYYRVQVSSWLVGAPGRIAHPLGVTKEGYAPFFDSDIPLLDPMTDSTYTVDVPLSRSDTRGVIRGRVRGPRGYLANIPVAFDYSTFPLTDILADASKKTHDPQPTSLLGASVRTDASGRFAIGHLAAGTYYVAVAFLPDDGYVQLITSIDLEHRVLIELEEGEERDIGTVDVVKAIRPIAPPNGAILTDHSPTLRWTSVPGATWYRLSAGSGHLLDFIRDMDVPAYMFDTELPPGTPIRWTVTAYDGTVRVATFEAVSTFYISR